MKFIWDNKIPENTIHLLFNSHLLLYIFINNLNIYTKLRFFMFYI